MVDGEGAILDTARTSTPSSEAALEAAVAGAVGDAGASGTRSRAVGLALAGFVTPDRRGVRFAPHLAWRDAPVADRIADRIGLPVVVEHDVNAAALAERRLRGGGGRRDTSCSSRSGPGIGSALLIDGELYRGAFGVAPELGHLRVVPDGRPCPCGKTRLLGALLRGHGARDHGRRDARPRPRCTRRCSAAWPRATPAR